MAKLRRQTRRAVNKAIREKRMTALKIADPRFGYAYRIPLEELSAKEKRRARGRNMVETLSPGQITERVERAEETIKLPEREIFLSCGQVAELSEQSERTVRKRATEWGADVDSAGRLRFPLSRLPRELQAKWLDRELLNGEGNLTAWAQAPHRAQEAAKKRAEIVAKGKERMKAGGTKGLKVYLKKEDVSVSTGTFYAWRKKFDAEGMVGLLPGYRYGGSPAAGTLTKEQAAYLESVWLRQSKPRMTDAWKLLVAWCKGREDPAPANGGGAPPYTVCRKHLNALPESVKVEGREGQKGLFNKRAPSVRRDYTDLPFNERWNADHCVLDMFCLGNNGKPIRPWLTAVQDLGTRTIVGFALMVKPSSVSIKKAFLRAFTAYGIPRHIHIDNGPDFSAKSFTAGMKTRFRKALADLESEGAFSLLGIDAHFCIPGNPGAKPVERFFGTMHGQFDRRFDSYCGRDAQEKPEQLKQVLAGGKIPTLAELEDHLNNYINGEYHQATHRGSGMEGRSPLEVFRYWTEEQNQAIRKAPLEELRLAMCPFKRRTVGRFGVKLFDQHYHSDELLAEQGKEVIVRWDPDDLSRVYVYTEKNTLLCAAPRLERTGFEDQSAIKRAKATQKKQKRAIQDLRDARRELIGGEPPDLMPKPADEPPPPERVIFSIEEAIETPPSAIGGGEARGKKKQVVGIPDAIASQLDEALEKQKGRNQVVFPENIDD